MGNVASNIQARQQSSDRRGQRRLYLSQNQSAFLFVCRRLPSLCPSRVVQDNRTEVSYEVQMEIEREKQAEEKRMEGAATGVCLLLLIHGVFVTGCFRPLSLSVIMVFARWCDSGLKHVPLFSRDVAFFSCHVGTATNSKVRHDCSTRWAAASSPACPHTLGASDCAPPAPLWCRLRSLTTILGHLPT